MPVKYLVTYASKYGHAKTYAQWIAEALHCEMVPARAVKGEVLRQYDVIIHGGGLYAGGLSGIDVFTRHEQELAGKALILFSCGLADPQDAENVAHIETEIAKVLSPELQQRVKQFHLRGGIDYKKLGPVHKAMMAMLYRSVRKKDYDSLRREDQMMLDTYGGQVDFLDQSTIGPLVDYVKHLADTDGAGQDI